MRYFGTDKNENYYVKLDSELIRTGHGELTMEERFLIAYFHTHRDGYQLNPEKIAEDTEYKKRKIQNIIASLEEKGYLYRNKENWDRRTGPEYIVAERKDILQRVLEAENLFHENEPPEAKSDGSAPDSKSDEPTPEKPTHEEPSIPDALLQIVTLEKRVWHRIPPKQQKPARFVRAPVRQPARAEEVLPNLWQLSIGSGHGVELRNGSVSILKQPSLSGLSVLWIANSGMHGCASLRKCTPVQVLRDARAFTPGMHERASQGCMSVHPSYIVRLRSKTKSKQTASLKGSRRLSNVWRQRARALAKAGFKFVASNRRAPPDPDRSHSRLWVTLFREKSGRPYHGIRAYSELENDWDFRPKLKESAEGFLSIYWLHPEREPGAPLPKTVEETSDIIERPLAEDADPRAAADVPERFAEVGVRCGPNATHPGSRDLRTSAGFDALVGDAQYSVKRGPHPWPDHLVGAEPELSFAGHRPDEQLPEIRRASEDFYSTEFIKRAVHAIFEEPFEEEPRDRTVTGEDERRAQKFGIPARSVMLLRKIAEVEIDPHGPNFDVDNTLDSSGRDPWPIRMYELAFPESDLSSSAKKYLDQKIGQANPSSPAEWASVLLMGLEQGWDPTYVKNFGRCYRHEMRIELDPGRSINARYTSRSRLTRGTGIDLSDGDPKKLIPPQDYEE